MDMRDIAELVKSDKYRAEVIGYADSVCYLVALVKEEDQFIDVIQDENGRPLRFKSLIQAKDWFREIGFKRIEFRMESPYDECFGERSEAAVMSIPLSH